VEARVPVGVGFGGASIVPDNQGFLLKEAGRTKYYDIAKLERLSQLTSPSAPGRRLWTAW